MDQAHFPFDHAFRSLGFVLLTLGIFTATEASSSAVAPGLTDDPVVVLSSDPAEARKQREDAFAT